MNVVKNSLVKIGRHDDSKTNHSDGSEASVVRFAMLPPQRAVV